jgi:hypothetical protein
VAGDHVGEVVGEDATADERVVSGVRDHAIGAPDLHARDAVRDLGLEEIVEDCKAGRVADGILQVRLAEIVRQADRRMGRL